MHHFRRAMKEWRALMRLLEPFIADAPRWRHDARDHARSLSHARDSQAALNAFDDLIDKPDSQRFVCIDDRPREQKL